MLFVNRQKSGWMRLRRELKDVEEPKLQKNKRTAPMSSGVDHPPTDNDDVLVARIRQLRDDLMV